MSEYGIVIAGHGSRDPASVEQFGKLVELIRLQAGNRPVTHGFLEFAAPTIDEALHQNVRAGEHEQIVMVPGLLLAASHAKNDMPAELLAFQAENPEKTFHMAASASLHPLLLEVCRERVIHAEASAAAPIPRRETCLVLVGRGTTDPDANSEVSKLARLLEEGMGFATSLVCYSGTAKPLVRDGISAAATMGFRRVIVLPFFLFDGVLVKRVYAAADAVRTRHPSVEILDAGYLGPDPRVAQVYLERAQEGLEGRGNMNCSLCKYRTQIIGFEGQVGTPQRGNHGKVRGLLDRETSEEEPEKITPFVPHPIEAESFEIITAGRDWSGFDDDTLVVLKRLVHTSGDFSVPEEIFISPGATEAGIRSIRRGIPIVTDVTMVQAGLKRAVLATLGVTTWCGVHDEESHLMAKNLGLTRSASGIRRAFEKFGNDCVVAIGDAPTAIFEAVRLIREERWRPQLIIGLPVGFVGTADSKAALRRCMQVPRITNHGTRGGSPWAATVVNALMILTVNRLAAIEAARDA